MKPQNNIPKDFEGLYLVQPKEKDKPLPDGSFINYGTDHKGKLALYYKSSELSKAKVYLLNTNTHKIYVDGVEGTEEDKLRMKQLFDYFQSNVKDNEAETLLMPVKKEE